MRPRDVKLRKRYIAAACAIRARGDTVTYLTLSIETGIGHKTIRSFLRRNFDITAEVSITRVKVHHSPLEYRQAVASVRKRDGAVTHKAIAHELNVCRPAVSKMFKAHGAYITRTSQRTPRTPCTPSMCMRCYTIKTTAGICGCKHS